MLHPTPTLKESPSQTGGPYVHIGLTPNYCGIHGVYDDMGAKIIHGDVEGERITLDIRLIDGSGAPLYEAIVETWQCDANGNFPDPKAKTRPAFTGWGRQPTDDTGLCRFETIKPGRVAAPDGSLMAPHIAVWIVARGINIGLQTRVYFEDEAEANEADFVLNKIPDKRRRKTLIARREDGPNPRYVLDVNFQGANETVFFDM